MVTEPRHAPTGAVGPASTYCGKDDAPGRASVAAPHAGTREGDDNALGRTMYLSTAVSPALDTSMSCILRAAF